MASTYHLDIVRLAPAEQIGEHRQPTWELSCVLVGSGVRHIGGRSEPFKGGDVVLVPPGIAHCWQFADDDTDEQGCISNITLTFREELLQRCTDALPELAGSIDRLRGRQEAVSFDRPTAGQLTTLLQRMEGESEARRFVTLLEVLVLMGENSRGNGLGGRAKASKEQLKLQRIKTYITCNARRDITLDSAARHMGMNRSAFCVFFRRATGKTFVDYLNSYRLKMACRLLGEGTHSVAEVCYQSGFNNVPYFNRVFKKYLAVTPTQWADTHATGKPRSRR